MAIEPELRVTRYEMKDARVEIKINSHNSKLKTRYLLSWGYWFSSRTLGLLVHPYITMRAICREHFFRPLVFLPVVIWIMSWIVAVMVGRLGLWLQLQNETWTIPVGYGLVFMWIWGSLFLSLWQIILGYLYIRFHQIPTTRHSF